MVGLGRLNYYTQAMHRTGRGSREKRTKDTRIITNTKKETLRAWTEEIKFSGPFPSSLSSQGEEGIFTTLLLLLLLLLLCL